ncbi:MULTISPECIES: DUF3748 domain-containing protein [Providencia]|uniref:DUF3748 domain-containing protein n=2 Tax=Morganellaceae TaxID=1903414 RepID=UPI000839877A|nr:MULTISPECIES: DUF3748 domain-containing protein [Providencia]MBP6121569.1 DUF3748 domain-containing protein [Providencia sp.]NIH21028.1 DUF3748 domain-containing protein [Providencia heimbachae]
MISKDNRLKSQLPYKEVRITHDSRSHQLTNINVWTPDSQWLAYDIRPSGSSFTGKLIEKIHVNTKQKIEIYHAKQGAHVGVVTVSSEIPPRYAFIHGPEYPDADWQYDFHHRRGVYVSDDQLNVAHPIDAMSITPPYVAGALRGGTHVHVFSPDGKWLSFTYNDHVMHELDIQRDQRNVAVAVPAGAVNVEPKKHKREYDGDYFCCVVTKTTLSPKPDSNEISRAYEEGWVGQKGYLNASDNWQEKALAFIGDTHSVSGEIIPEVFIIDLPSEPESFKVAGSSPLQGTEFDLPSPPKYVQQRRLTYTHQRKYPGLAKQPRHWLRSSPNGESIACLMHDDEGIVQLWLVSTKNSALTQITNGTSSIQSAFNWDSKGEHICFVYDNSITLCHIATGVLQRLTEKTEIAPVADAVVFSPDNRLVAFMRDIDSFRQLYTVETGLDN